jgi:hypothetical protein
MMLGSRKTPVGPPYPVLESRVKFTASVVVISLSRNFGGCVRLGSIPGSPARASVLYWPREAMSKTISASREKDGTTYTFAKYI